MLEKQADLRTWRLLQPAAAGSEIPAEALPPHRLSYLDYEGPVSGNRGKVVRWDAGQYVSVVDREECVEVELHGERLNGRAVLRRAADGRGWSFYFTASSSVSPA